MRLGRVIGKVWATVKDEQLDAVKLAIIEVVDENQHATGTTFIAADSIGCRDRRRKRTRWTAHYRSLRRS